MIEKKLPDQEEVKQEAIQAVVQKEIPKKSFTREVFDREAWNPSTNIGKTFMASPLFKSALIIDCFILSDTTLKDLARRIKNLATKTLSLLSKDSFEKYGDKKSVCSCKCNGIPK